MRWWRPALAQLSRSAETGVLAAARPDGRPGRELARASSAASRRGIAWFGLTAVLAASGGRRRRAAAEGAAAWLAATGVAGLVKRRVGRRRPALPARLGPATNSSSMPSSHAASAVAYAVAAGLVDPPIGVGAGSLAALVAWSRVAAQRHFPTDVAAGAALGGITGLLVHGAAARLRPARPGSGGPEDGQDDGGDGPPGSANDDEGVRFGGGVRRR